MSTYRITASDTGQEVILQCDEMEWILNSLRLMQARQLELAQENQVIEHISLSEELFVPQHEDVTTLRERLVGMVGRDLTDDGC